MLHALGFSDEEMPKLIVHGLWNVRGAKMSKSLGNVIDPNNLANTFTPDGLRYYLMRDIATGYDSDFSEERIVMSYNKELAGGLGNLLNRALNMANRYRSGVVKHNDFDDEVSASLRTVVADAEIAYPEKMNAWSIHQAIEEAWKIVTAANGYIEQTQPFKLAKDETQAVRLDAVLRHLAESIAHVSVLLDPIMPTACAAIRAQLGWTLPAGFTLKDLHWGLLPDGHQLGQGTPVFPRVDLPAEAS